MSDGEPTVGVVICCYTERRWDLLSACVREVSAQAETEGAAVAVVVDHNAALRDRCAAEFPSVTVVENRHERGLSGARNTGIESLDREVLLFVDDDAVPRAGWLAAMRSAFADPDLLAVGGEVVAVWPGSRDRPRWLPPEFDWAIGCDYAGMAPFGAQIRNPIGANMGLRRPVAVEAGAFRSVLGRRGGVPSGCEETDLAIRMRAVAPSGGIRRIPGAPVDHHVSADRCTGRYLIRRCFAEGGSKATLMRLEGAARAMSAEADHALVAIPRAVGRELSAFARGDRAALSRIWWTVAGLVAAVAGWSDGLLRRGTVSATTGAKGAPEDGAHVPVWCVDRTAEPMEATRRVPGDTLPGRVHVLVRANHRPIGQVDVALDPMGDVAGQLLSACEGLRDAAPAPAPSWPGGTTTASVVVCSLGRADTLPAAVRSVLFDQTRRAHEVIVVDNDPESGRVARALRGIADPRLRIVTEPRRGVSRARNAGIAAAIGQVVAFTDDDVEAEPDWLARVCEVFDADTDAEIGCVTGLVVPADLGLVTHRWFEESSGFERGYRPMVWEPGGGSGLLTRLSRYEPHVVAGRRGPAYPVAGSEFGSGNNMVLRREWLAAVGGFDTVLGTGSPARGGEDLDMFRRMILGGAAIVYQPAAIVRHHHRATMPALRRQMYDYGVGMCANVIRFAVSGGPALLATAAVLPGGLRLLLDPGSEKNRDKSADYPRELTYIELAGYLTGPVHLLRSRVREGGLRRRR